MKEEEEEAEQSINRHFKPPKSYATKEMQSFAFKRQKQEFS